MLKILSNRNAADCPIYFIQDEQQAWEYHCSILSGTSGSGVTMYTLNNHGIFQEISWPNRSAACNTPIVSGHLPICMEVTILIGKTWLFLLVRWSCLFGKLAMLFLHPNFFFPNQQLSKHLSLVFQTPQVSVKKSRQMWIKIPWNRQHFPMGFSHKFHQAGCCLGVVATGASLAVLSRLGDDQVPWGPHCVSGEIYPWGFPGIRHQSSWPKIPS